MGSWHLILFPPQLFWLKAAWKARLAPCRRLPGPLQGPAWQLKHVQEHTHPTYIYIYVCICIYIYIYLHIDISYCARRLVKSRVANLPDPLLGCGRLAARPRQEQGGLSARPTPWLWAACSQTSPGAGWPQPDPLLWLWAACSQTPVRSRVASEPDPLLGCGRLAARPRSGAGWPQSQTHSLAVGGLQPDPGQEQGGLRARPTP